MDRGRSGTGKGFVSSQGKGRREHGGISLGEDRTSLSISEDGPEFHFCKPDKMKLDLDLMKDYKSSLRCVGGYSVDDEQNFWNDKSCLSFLNTDFLPNDNSKEKLVHFDLNTAKDSEKPYNGTTNKSFENFLSFITSNLDPLTEILSYETKFVFLKNVFAKLVKIPYSYGLDLNFYATYLNGIVYLLNYKNGEEYNSVPELWRFGPKFRQYLTYGENVEEGVVCNRDYRCVMTAKLGPHNLLFSASTDCFNPNTCDFESLDPSSSILLKCNFDNPARKEHLKRFKMYEWCTSLACLTIPHVLVGFRNYEGIVKVLKLYTEEDLMQHGKPYWDLNVAFTFVKDALSFIEKTTKAKSGTVFFFTKSKQKSHIKAEETNMENFPPKCFTEELKEAGIFENVLNG